MRASRDFTETQAWVESTHAPVRKAPSPQRNVSNATCMLILVGAICGAAGGIAAGRWLFNLVRSAGWA